MRGMEENIMSKIRMDTSDARGAQRSIKNVANDVSNILQSSTNVVAAMQSTWVGNSANEFLSLYDEWRRQTLRIIKEINDMERRLDSEIDSYEEMARRLG